VDAAEHSGAARPPDLDHLLAEDGPDELLDPRIVGVEPVRSDVEVEVSVVERAGEATDDRIPFDDRDGIAGRDQLVRDRQAGNAGADDDDGSRYRSVRNTLTAGFRNTG
jgi:hypothetical protein